ncbi:MAG: sigma-70 family RNA polymerase sigma factor [Desulfuromonadales bacterium]|nr:sigma-70 family RNA polymerase sigma factor [Desulfuromonadales bacterium]
MTDEELMRAYGAGDQEAFSRLYERHKNRLFGYLLGRLRDRAAAEEVFQSVFLKLHRTRDSYRAELPFLPWLFTIARSVLVDHLRRESSRQSRIILDEERVGAAVAETPAEPMSFAALLAAMPSLSTAQRQVLELRFAEGLNFREIAERLDLTPANARQLASRALGRLRRLLSGKGDVS